MKTYEFDNMNPEATVLRGVSPLVVEKPRALSHVHTYGGESKFFEGLTHGKLYATRCTNKGSGCVSAESGEMYLPPRVYCPDCLERMEWVELKNPKAKIHTHITIKYPGAFNRLPLPAHLISVEIEGVVTIMMSYLVGAEPKIGMEIEPRFNTTKPTFSILDLHWVPKGYKGR